MNHHSKTILLTGLVIITILCCSQRTYSEETTQNSTNQTISFSITPSLPELPELPVEISDMYGFQEKAFSYSDINLTQGSLAFSEVDLKLPGKNGMDIVIARQYNSQHYRSKPNANPIENHRWSNWCSSGWSFNLGARAFALNAEEHYIIDGVPESTYVNKEKQVVIQQNGVSEIYDIYNEQNISLRSKTPGNFNRVNLIFEPASYIPNMPRQIKQIELHTASGLIMIFSKRFYFEYHLYTCETPPVPVNEEVSGFYLTGIRNLNNTKITFEYEEISPGQVSVPTKQIGDILFNDYYDTRLNGSDVEIIEQTAWMIQYRPQKIIDSFQREININYLISKDQEAETGTYLISSIQYLNTNSGQNQITYSYDSNLNLISVEVNDLPEKTYSYQYYQPEFMRCTRAHQQHGYQDIFDRPYFPDDHEPYSNILNIQNYPYDQMYGYILNSRTSPLEANITYTFKDMLTTYPWTVNERDKNGNIYYNGFLIEHASFPVVVKREITESPEKPTLAHEFEYPYNVNPYSNEKRFTKAEYNPSYLDEPNAKLFYFSSVTVTNPLNLESEIYEFENALLTKHTQGVFESTTGWNYDNNTKTKITNKKAGIVQISTEFNNYDEYRHPTSIVTKKDDQVIMTKETSFYTESAYIEKNLLHLVKSKKLIADNKTRSSFFTYTDLGQPKELYKGENASGTLLKTFDYDNEGRISSQKTRNSDNAFSEVNYTYNLGTTYDITKTLNSANPKTQKSIYELKTGKLIKTIDTNNQENTYEYDDYGRVVKIIYPDQSQDTYSYSADLKTSSITASGKTLSFTIDNLGRKTFVDYPEGEEDIKYEYYYGQSVDKVYKYQNNSWLEKADFDYDTYLRKAKSQTPDWGETTYSYDDTNNRITITDPQNRSLIKQKDKLGRLISETFTPDNSITSFIYDNFNNILQTTGSKDLVYRADYDTYGKTIKTYRSHSAATPVCSIKIHSETEYFDNDLARSVTIEDEQGNTYRTYSYTYDEENRLINLKLNHETAEVLTYDEENRTNSLGRLTTAQNEYVKTEYDFDNMGRTVKETTTILPLDLSYAIHTGYDTNGNVSQVIYNDGKSIDYSYVAGTQRLSEINYDSRNIVNYTYNSNGTIKELLLGNGIIIYYTYTKEVLLTNITVKNSNNAMIFYQSYNHDMTGNITSTQHTNYMHFPGGDPTREYTYNQKDELTEVVINGNTTYSHSYDANGNHLKLEIPNSKILDFNNMVIDPDSDKLTKKIYTNNKEVIFNYDPEGNMTQKKRIQDNVTVEDIQYTYNYQNQLETVRKDNQAIATYHYNHKGERVYNNANTTGYQAEKYYYWDLSGRIIGEGQTDFPDHPERSGQKAHIVRYIYAGNEKIAMARPDWQGNEDLFYFINNAQGTPMLILNQEGEIVFKNNMDEWGNLGKFFAGFKNEINFTGKKLDPGTGLYYFNQRYYDPEIGRFLTPDPARQSLNAYLYCANNPLHYIDAYGLWGIRLEILGYGFSVGDKGISVSCPIATIGVDFTDGSAYGSVGVNLSSGVYVEDYVSVGYDLSLTHTHSFTHGGDDASGLSLSASSEFFGAGYNANIFYDARHRRAYFGGDWFLDANEMGRDYNRYKEWETLRMMEDKFAFGALLEEIDNEKGFGEKHFTHEEIINNYNNAPQKSLENTIRGIDILTAPIPTPKMPRSFEYINKIQSYSDYLYKSYQIWKKKRTS
ncbi:RHS repeat domain-containing protein [Candidatus Margulisiibacteriota bacterium]